jgi:hypothetical protein
MNLSKKIALLSAAFAAAFGFSLLGCGNSITIEASEEDVAKEAEGQIDYKSYTGSDAAFFVENQSSKKLVAFKGDVSPETLIGGVNASEKVHGFKRTTMFQGAGDFPLVLITEDEYKKNIKDLRKENVVVFATIYAFYNDKITANNVFKISAKAGGSGKITLNNMTNWNVELRENSPTGEVLGYVAAQTTSTVMSVNAPDDYVIFPVFKKFVPGSQLRDAEIYEVIPTYKEDGILKGMPYAKEISLTSSTATVTWNLNDLARDIDGTLSSGGIYIKVVNNNNGSAIRFMRGDEEQMTSMGVRGIPPSSSNTFAIKIDKNADGKYPESAAIGGLKVTTAMGVEIPISDYIYDLDYTYTITATGTNQNTLKLMSNEDWINNLQTVADQAKYKESQWIIDNAASLFEIATDEEGNESYVGLDDTSSEAYANAQNEYNKWLKKVRIEKSESRRDLSSCFNNNNCN